MSLTRKFFGAWFGKFRPRRNSQRGRGAYRGSPQVRALRDLAIRRAYGQSISRRPLKKK